MEKISLLDVSFERKNREDYKGELVRLMQHGRQALVVTPNPEMLVASEKDVSLKDVLNRAQLSIVDGFGIILLAQFFGGGLVRFPGTDVLKFVSEQATEQGLKILIAGGIHDGDAQKAADKLASCHSEPAEESLNSKDPSASVRMTSSIVGYSPGKIQLTEHGWEGDQELKRKIEEEQPDILVLGLGHGKQEKWLADHLKQFPSVKLGMGVGGAVEFYAGRQVRAPKMFRQLGLEWLYRLVRQPRRIGRIFTALVTFPTLVILEKIRHNP